MAKIRGATRRRASALAALSLLAVAALRPDPGATAEDDAAPRAQSIEFDIPAQGLDSALDRYVRTSGAQLLYETSLAAGRRSPGVKGRLTTEAALRALLAGSGLVGMRADVDAFIITPATRTEAAITAPRAPDSRFLGALQARMLSALCGDARTRPGAYRVALELWITPGGTIRRGALLGSTGDETRDAALIEALRGLEIGATPPPALPQPVILAIAPKPPRETGDCDGR